MKYTTLTRLSMLGAIIFMIASMLTFYFFGFNVTGTALFLIGTIIIILSLTGFRRITGVHTYAMFSTILGLIAIGIFGVVQKSQLITLLLLVNFAVCFFVIAMTDFGYKKRTVRIVNRRKIDYETQIKYGQEAEKIFRELDRIESNLSRMEKETREKKHKAQKKTAKKKSVKKKTAKKVAKKTVKKTKKSTSRDANLVACKQDHEMATILKYFNKVNSKENREILKKLCKQYKSLKSQKPHNREGFYKYIKKLAEFRKIKNAKVVKTITKTARKTVKKSEQKYLAVKGAKTFHLPSCTILLRQDPKKYVHYKTREDAMAKAHRPCRVCNP